MDSGGVLLWIVVWCFVDSGGVFSVRCFIDASR